MGKLKFYLLAIIACLGWGSAFVFIKLTLGYAPVFQLSGWRFMLAGLILFPFMSYRKEDLINTFKEWRFLLVFSFFQIFLQYSLYFAGIDLVPASVAAIVVGLSPLVVFTMAHFAFHNDKFTSRKIVSLLLGMVGILVITLNKGKFTSTNPYYLWGILMVFLSVFINCGVNIVVAKNKRKIPSMSLAALSNFFGGVMLYIVSLAIEEQIPAAQFPAIFYVYLVVIAIISAMGFAIWFYLLQVPGLKVSQINVWKFIIPVFGVLLSWIIFPDDKPNLFSVIGIVSITLSILILQLTGKETTVKKNDDSEKLNK